MTPSQALSRVRSQFSEDTAAFLSDVNDLYPYMSEAEMELANEVGFPQTTDSSTPTVSGTQEYTKPADCLRIEILRWNGLKLKKIDLQEYETISGTYYGATVTRGNPVYYYEYGDIVGLYPIPDTAQTLKYYYIKRPAEITAASTAFTVPEEAHPAIIDYCMFRAYLKDEDGRAKVHQESWEQRKIKLKLWWESRKYRDQIVTVRDVNTLHTTDFGLI